MTYAKTGLKWRYLHMTALGFRGRNTWGRLPKKGKQPRVLRNAHPERDGSNGRSYS